MEFVIKIENDWTLKLYNLIKESNFPFIYVDGPYGRTIINWEDEIFDYFLFIAGGIGVTPLVSITKNLLTQSNSGRKIKKINFFHTARNKTLRYLVDDLHNLDNKEILHTEVV